MKNSENEGLQRYTAQIFFVPARPGNYLRADIADILSALSAGNRDPEYHNALRDVATAMGLLEVDLAAAVSLVLRAPTTVVACR